ncbi:hypothetical protein [Streptomyces sp. NPDC051173]|uniref:hypothetical protein n=1 Tax=Streptomyces sp. NPDC051173 TaxID=3155164 RepID=UPI00344E933A
MMKHEASSLRGPKYHSYTVDPDSGPVPRPGHARSRSAPPAPPPESASTPPSPPFNSPAGKDGEQWHFRPIDGKPNAFGIVPPKNYGWVDFAAVGKKVTGTWTFDTDNQPWTTDATVTVPVINSAAGSTMYIARTSTDAPGSGTSSADIKPAALARTATDTIDVPAGGKLTADKGGVQVSDANGSTIATVHPGTVTDTNGTTHKVDLAVDGNTVTQTIEGVTGDTITGTITPPAFSLGSGAAAPAAKAVKMMTAAKCFMAAPAADNNDEHDKCMAKKIGAGIVKGGLWGTLRGGPEGAAIGMLTGTFKGIATGVIECRDK